MQKYQFTGHLSPRPTGTERAMCALSGYVYLASEVESLRDSYQAALGGIEYRDARILELEKALRDVKRFLEDPRWGTYPYMENSDIYEDKDEALETINSVLMVSERT